MIRDRVRHLLESHEIHYAVVGGIAVAARGAPRFTLDFDILTTDRRVLHEFIWNELVASGVPVEVRKGDYDDPLAGVVRIGAAPGEIDIVVGKWPWQQQIIDRAESVEIGGLRMPLPTVSDLILLKLDAGGPIDQQDVIRLLAVGPREQIIADVSNKIGDLPDDARALWNELVSKTAH